MTDLAKDIPNVTITAISSEGLGIVRHEGKVIFVEKALPGDVADIRIYKRKKNFNIAKVTSLISSSEQRSEPFCKHFGLCGGCKWQNLGYERQLHYKHQIVADAFERIGKIKVPEIPAVIGSAETQYFRNKLEYTFSDNRWMTTEDEGFDKSELNMNGLGFHIPKMFDKILNIDECFLQSEPSNSIRNAVKKYADDNGIEFFNIRKKRGLLRNLLIRTATTGEVLVLVSFYDYIEEQIGGLMDHLETSFPSITSLQYVINPKVNETIYDLDIITYFGREFIYEQLGDYKFKIGPKSFFQTNTKQAHVLYDVINNFAELKGRELVLDLYSGVGSIAISMSKQCRKVIGIEQIGDAVIDARGNADLNNITNTKFTIGDVRKIMTEDFYKKNGQPDLIITDPPRAGMHPDVIKSILSSKAPKVIYVSCNPATQARDLKMMSEHYEIVKMQPVDMFPHTTHIENVVVLQKKDKTEISNQ